jgi:hypothetical protein
MVVSIVNPGFFLGRNFIKCWFFFFKLAKSGVLFEFFSQKISEIKKKFNKKLTRFNPKLPQVAKNIEGW